ncbi:MAG: MCE family protein [Candidatus Aminicenantes bacterium]|nr:MCE family protein [Candidatus Aminicenantes bacterium]
MSREARIGIFVGAAFLVLAAFVFVVGDFSVLFRKPGETIRATFDTAAGLDKRAVVKMAGVLIGHVRDISLEGRKAKVEMTIYAGTKVPKDSRAMLNMLGLLGEKYVEILPGESDEACPDGGEIAGLASIGLDRIGPLLGGLSDEIRGAAAGLRETLDEETRAGLRAALAGLSRAAEELRAFLEANRGALPRAADEAARTFEAADKTLAGAASDLDRTLALLRETVEENRDGLRTSLEKIGELAVQVEEAVGLLSASLDKIARGEGTAGRLVHDPSLYDEARAAVRRLEAAGRGLSAIRPSLEVEAGYLGRTGRLRAGVLGGLRPTPRASLEAGLVRDPREEAFRFSLVGGYRMGRFLARFGFIESEFGAGVDFFSGRDGGWGLSFEGFAWNRDEGPHLRFTARGRAVGRLYVVAGVDDFSLAKRREVFVGLGWRFP